MVRPEMNSECATNLLNIYGSTLPQRSIAKGSDNRSQNLTAGRLHRDGKTRQHRSQYSQGVCVCRFVLETARYAGRGQSLNFLQTEKSEFSGSMTKEIKLARQSGKRLVSFKDRKQMKSMSVTVARFNKKNGLDNGVKVKCRYDYDNLLILLYLTPFDQVSLEECQSSQEEPQCVPP